MLMKEVINMLQIQCPKCGTIIRYDDNNEDVDSYSAVNCPKCNYIVDLYGSDHIQY